jgi:DNA-binding transcriptional ArsR family regulator
MRNSARRVVLTPGAGSWKLIAPTTPFAGQAAVHSLCRKGLDMDQSIGGPAQAHISQAQLLSAVADPLRLGILAAVRRPHPVTEICEALGGLAQPRVSHHLAVLRDHGLVSVERRGRQRLYGWARVEQGPVADLLMLLARWLQADAPPSSRESTPPRAAARAPASPGELEDFLL